MFDQEEIQALVLGARIVAQFGDPALARASESILSKVASVLPKELAFRNVRLDRISAATLGDRFEEEPGRTLRDMLQQDGPAAVRLPD
jgi:predicted DNA-binding transcriptional regulator YafY